MSASVWQPGGSSIAVNAENASLVQKFIASAGQTVFTLTQFSYVVGTGSIRVYRNGVKLAASEVTELTTTTFSVPALVLGTGEVIECSAVLGSQDAVTAAAINAAASAAASAASATAAAGVVASVDFTKTSVSTFSNKTLDSSCDLSAASGQLAGFRNKLINGNFDIWQRYSASIGTGFLADRWNMFSGSLQDSSGFSQAELETYGARYYLSAYSNAGVITTVQQPIEGVDTLSGKTVTLSFWAMSTTLEAVAVTLAQMFGSGGATTTSTSGTVSPSNYKATWTKHYVTLTLPSIAGKAAGVGNYLGVQIGRNAGAAGLIGITGVQLEEGSIATPFENRPIGLELSLCQRYYNEVYPSGIAFSTTGFSTAMSWPVDMRVVPTAVLAGSALFRKTADGTTTSIANTPIYAVGTKGCQFISAIAWSTPLVIGQAYDVWQQSTRLTLNAEL